MADRLVDCADDVQLIADGGYRRPERWLGDGWAVAQAQGWRAPAYWLALTIRGVRIVQQQLCGKDWMVCGR